MVVAGLCLVPFSLTSLLASRALPWFSGLFGQRALLPFGSLIVALSGAFFALAHGALWQAFVMMGVLGAGLGATFAAIPGLIVRAVPEHETGSAMGFYQVVRYVGFSLGSALAAAPLASETPAGEPLPTEQGFELVLWTGAAVCVMAAALAWALPARSSTRRSDPGLGELAEQEAELATAGLVGPSDEPRDGPGKARNVAGPAPRR